MRRIIIFVFLLCSVSLFAQEISTTPHKHRFIELVNSGEFELAEVYMTLVEDWTFDSENKSDYLDLEKALHFGSLLDSIQVVKADRDSFLLYLNEYVTLYGNYLYNRGDYSAAEQYYLESLRILSHNLQEKKGCLPAFAY